MPPKPPEAERQTADHPYAKEDTPHDSPVQPRSDQLSHCPRPSLPRPLPPAAFLDVRRPPDHKWEGRTASGGGGFGEPWEGFRH